MMRIHSSSRFVLASLLTAFAGASTSGCSKKPATALVVAIQSEATIPKEIDSITVQVDRADSTPFYRTYELAAGMAEAKLPGTISLEKEQSDDSSDPIKVTITASANGVQRVLRDATLGFQDNHTKLLRMPLRYSCFDFPDCDSGQTCIGGQCVSDQVDVDSLPDFDGSDPFPVEGTAGCFDDRPSVCLKSPTSIDIATVVADDCHVSVGDVSGKLNLALHWSAQDADPSDTERLVVLDQDKLEGWTFGDAANTSFTLAQGICDAAKAGKITSLYYSSACSPKVITEPVCQVPATEGGGQAGAGDGGAAGVGGHSAGNGSGGKSGAGGAAGMTGHAGMSGAGGGTASGGAGAGGVAGMTGHAGMSGGGGAAGVSGGGGVSGSAGAGGSAGMSGASGSAGMSGAGGSAGTSGAGGSSGATQTGPIPTWSKILGLATGNDQAYGVAAAPNGDVAWSGYFETELDFDATHILPSNGAQRCFVARMNAGGTDQWAIEFGAQSFNCITEGASLAFAPDGQNLAFGAKFNTTIQFGSINLAPSNGDGDFDGVVVSIDPSGNVLWANPIGAAMEDNTLAVAVGPDGGVAAAGYFTTSIALGPSMMATGLGAYDGFVVVYDSKGQLLWGHAFGDVGDQRGTGVAFDANGNVYLTGEFSGTIDVGGGPIVAQGSTDSFVAKYDSNGVFQNALPLPGTQITRAGAVASNPTLDRIDVALTYNGSPNFGVGTLPDNGGDNMMVLELKDDLTPTRNQVFTTDFGVAVGAISVGLGGDVGVAYSFAGHVDFGAFGAFAGEGNQGYFDGLFIHLDSSLAPTWVRAVQGPHTELGSGVAIGPDGALIGSGRVEESVDFGAGLVTAAGGYDAYVVSYPGVGITPFTIASTIDHPSAVTSDSKYIYFATYSSPSGLYRCPAGAAACNPELVSQTLLLPIITSLASDGANTLFGTDYNQVWACDTSALPCTPTIYDTPSQASPYPSALSISQGYLTWSESVGTGHQVVTCALGATCAASTVVIPEGGVIDTYAIAGMASAPDGLYIQDFNDGGIVFAPIPSPGSAATSSAVFATPDVPAAAGLLFDSGKLYFGTQVPGGYLYRCSVSAGCKDIGAIIGPEGQPQRLAITAGRLYWADAGLSDGEGGVFGSTGVLRTALAP